PLVVLVSVSASLLMWLDGPPFLRVPLGLLAVLFLPGYSLTAAMFPRRADFDAVERIGLGFALSPVMATVLALTRVLWPVELGFTPLVLALTTLTVIATIVEWWRKRSISMTNIDARAQLDGTGSIRFGRTATVALGAAGVIGAIAIG